MADINELRERFLDEYGKRKYNRGKEEEKLEIVKAMLSSGSTLEYTSLVSKLPLEWIKQIYSELKNDSEEK